MLKVYSTEYDASKYCADTLQCAIEKNPHLTICLAAGHTSLAFFDILIERGRQKKIDFSNVCVVGLDEWVGLSGKDDGSCENFLRENIFNHINVNENNIRLLDGKAANLEHECRQIDQFIKGNGGIDYLLLGMGMNGHLALNEPGVDESKTSHVAVLDSVTKTVADKYFKGTPDITEGITLGIKNIVAAKKIQLLITGERKREIVSKLIMEEQTNMLPGSLLKKVKHAEFVLDSEASSLLNIK